MQGNSKNKKNRRIIFLITSFKRTSNIFISSTTRTTCSAQCTTNIRIKSAISNGGRSNAGTVTAVAVARFLPQRACRFSCLDVSFSSGTSIYYYYPWRRHSHRHHRENIVFSTSSFFAIRSLVLCVGFFLLLPFGTVFILTAQNFWWCGHVAQLWKFLTVAAAAAAANVFCLISRFSLSFRIVSLVLVSCTRCHILPRRFGDERVRVFGIKYHIMYSYVWNNMWLLITWVCAISEFTNTKTAQMKNNSHNRNESFVAFARRLNNKRNEKRSEKKELCRGTSPHFASLRYV